ncbi:related to ribosomal protein [Cephalotrichum gorgonifer]|uniref:Small ribosomal subunit protein bS6m n=1 Tax=Cephalotrichum gorgonifer TaxID=2041049 RepID=A0AAE8SWJ3_9PEZI|nr:related to ribosomal protein [Cephalotrichum gorgonifer]
MKLTGLVFIASLAAGVLALPAADSPTSPVPNLAERAGLETRAAKCVATSDCSWGYAGKCEQFCRVLGYDFRKMEKCDWLNRKRCCCKRPSLHAPSTMLYELIGIVRPGNLAEVKEIALTCGQLVLRKGGVIRGIQNHGVYALPRPVTRHQMKHREGHHFVMRYDASPEAHAGVRSTMRIDPRVIRAAHVKLGSGSLADAARFGPVKWDT